jgi:hypothetical protein
MVGLFFGALVKFLAAPPFSEGFNVTISPQSNRCGRPRKKAGKAVSAFLFFFFLLRITATVAEHLHRDQ